MRRNFMTLAAAAGLSTALLVAGSAGPAMAQGSVLFNKWQTQAQVSCSGISGEICSTFQGGGDEFAWVQDGTSDYGELKDANGLCLDFVGNSTPPAEVNEESCNNRVAELWEPVQEGSSSYSEYINDYGTSLFSHDACLWNADPQISIYGSPAEVVKCVRKQPPRQQWAL
jgi:hypothetical protein